jgi:hypothetical protein
MRRHRWLLLVALFVSACAARQAQAPVLPDGPLAWQEGYKQGYNSLLASIGAKSRPQATGQPVQFVQYAERMQTDPLYREGWYTGWNVMKTRFEAWQREHQRQETEMIWLMLP